MKAEMKDRVIGGLLATVAVLGVYSLRSVNEIDYSHVPVCWEDRTGNAYCGEAKDAFSKTGFVRWLEVQPITPAEASRRNSAGKGVNE